MKATLSLLAMAELSTSSRMLLQYRPQFPAIPRPPGWTPGAPAPPVYTPPAQPNNPWAPSPPTFPVPAPAVVYTTAPPPTMPQVTVAAGASIHKCEAGQPMPGMPPPCSMVEMTITNPMDGFSFECSVPGACAGSTFNMNLDLMTSNVASFSGIKCGNTGSCDGATFIFNNGQAGGHSLEINTIECNGAGSCSNMEVVLGYDTWVMEMVCNPDECANCKIRTMDPLDPPIACNVMASQGGKYPA